MALIGFTGVAVVPQALNKPRRFPPTSLATMKPYCSGCHSNKRQAQGITRRTFRRERRPKSRPSREGRAQTARPRVMPPPGAKQPDAAAVDSLVTWLPGFLDGSGITDQVVLHRLNRKEYENAVHDLLLVDVKGAELLPPDDIAQGFDNIASALQVSPSFIEQYAGTARNVAVEALGKSDARTGLVVPPIFRRSVDACSRPASRHSWRSTGESRPACRRRISHQHQRHGHPYLGQRYGVRESAGRDALDVEIIYQATIGGEEDMKAYDQVQSGALDRVNSRLKHQVHDYRRAAQDRRAPSAPEFRGNPVISCKCFRPAAGRIVPTALTPFQLRGPFDVKGLSATPSRDRIHDLQSGQRQSRQNKKRPKPARKRFSRLCWRAYRRPGNE